MEGGVPGIYCIGFGARSLCRVPKEAPREGLKSRYENGCSGRIESTAARTAFASCRASSAVA